ncbi:hypothetical protein BG006_004900 [Podila minutissima]|uniref:Uncharacterized protein n=1 Tax=Podila minutissima TaxID=64525 RepID=A0A9P5VM36_9FUNG|nr:hypothetical protein BG006_004900 [Podila minutissima]
MDPVPHIQPPQRIHNKDYVARLIKDPKIIQELRLIARKLVQKQRNTEDSAPTLFVILPTLLTHIHSSSSSSPSSSKEADPTGLIAHEYRLYFLCDYGDNVDTPLQLHLCDHIGNNHHNHHQHPASGTVTASGYVLRDLEEFLSVFQIPMLSLLRALLDNRQESTAVPGTVASDPTLYDRCQVAIQLLASYSVDELKDIRNRPLEADTTDYDSYPPVRSSDFAHLAPHGDPHMEDSEHDGPQAQFPIALGGLYQVSSSTGSILWVCPSHNEIICKSAAEHELHKFVELHQGDCLPTERAVEILFTKRENAQHFYDLLCKYQCVLKLKILLGWPHLDEEDLWRLYYVVHRTKIRDLTVDCCNGEDMEEVSFMSKPMIPTEEATEQKRQQRQREQEQRRQLAMDTTGSSSGLNFKPLLGMIFRQGLVSLTVENFLGYIPQLHFEQPLVTPNSNISDNTYIPFSMTEFHKPSDVVRIPYTNHLKKCALRHWTQKPNLASVCILVQTSPNLTELEMECDSIETTFAHLYQATNAFRAVTFLRLSENPRESAEITLGRSGDHHDHDSRPTFKRIQRTTSRVPSETIQSICGLETLVVTQCLELWDKPEVVHNIVHNNAKTLCNVELSCRTDKLVDMWHLLARNSEGKFRIRLNDTVCSLMSWDRHQPRYTALVVHSYKEEMGHRWLFQNLRGIAATLCVSPRFVDLGRLQLMCEHLVRDGLPAGGFDNLVVFLTPKTVEAVEFVQAWRSVVGSLQELRHFTMRVYASTFKGGAWLLKLWNAVTGMGLEPEYGQWIEQTTAEQSHPFSKSVQVPDNGTVVPQMSHFQPMGAVNPSLESAERPSRRRKGRLSLSSENIHETNATGKAPMHLTTNGSVVSTSSFAPSAATLSKTLIVYVLRHEIS